MSKNLRIAREDFPDAKLTHAQRDALKELVRIIEIGRSSHELMHLSGAFEDAANRKRREEGAGS